MQPLFPRNTTRDDRPPKLDLTVVIPAFNEGAVIGEVVTGVKDMLGDIEVVVVDDGSTDATAVAAQAAGARVVRVPENSGNGSAVKAGIRAATGEYIAFMDGDGQHTPDDLSRLLAFAGAYDMIVGARNRDGQASLGRRLANATYNKLASMLTGRQIADLTSGFRVVKRAVAEEFLPLYPNGFSYPTTITLATFRSGYSVKYVPIKARQRVGHSKIKPLKDGINFLIVMFKVITLFSPIKAFLPLALVPLLAALGTTTAAALGIAPTWTISMVCMMTFLLTLGIGLVSEQICSMRFERLNTVAEMRLGLASGQDVRVRL